MPWSAPQTERWTVGDDVTWCQLALHDAGAIFARDELLQWYQDAYRQLLAQSHATRQWRGLDVPPRYTYTYTQSWEQGFTELGTSLQLGYRQTPAGLTCTYAWEVEDAEDLTATDGAAVLCTQLWEYAHLPSGASTDQYYTFAVPRMQDRAARVYWDNKALAARSVRELDRLESFWWREQGEPWIWTRGTGGSRHFDLYQLPAGYNQGYDLFTQEATNSGGEHGAPYGIVRELSGGRTYAVSTDDPGGIPYGGVRDLTSSDRQYLGQPTWEPPYGTIREWHSAASSVLLWEIVIPDYPRLSDDDTPWMVPAPLQKYLRACVLWRAFGRQGESQRLDLAAYHEQRWMRGIALLKRLGWVTRRDRELRRQPREAERRAVPRPRLPSTFPRWIGV
jgi:hypothetical protein